MNENRTTLKTCIEIFLVSLKLGLTSFGGPIAHLGYFHEEYIRRRKWLDEKSYADLVALCQFLPGPASSQVGIGIGIMRGGLLGGIISFLGFTMPSVVALIIFALIVGELNVSSMGWIHGLKIVAVAVVAHAILGMAKNLAPDLTRKAIVILALAVVLLWQTVYAQVGVIIIAGLIGYLLYKETSEDHAANFQVPISKKLGLFCITLFLVFSSYYQF